MSKMKFKIIKILFCLVLFNIFVLFIINVSASSETFDINSVGLYNATNTYNYKLEENEKTTNYNFDNNYRYYLNKHNDEKVDDGAPLLTVLTHGLGGKGGNGGNGSTGSNALNVYGYGGIGGLRGAGNQGGAGGLGGNSGQNGNNGSNGRTGIMGVSGSSGVGGIDGYNVIGNELGIKNTLYVFNKDFIIHIFN